jgi:hypothetical protein
VRCDPDRVERELRVLRALRVDGVRPDRELAVPERVEPIGAVPVGAGVVGAGVVAPPAMPQTLQ